MKTAEEFIPQSEVWLDEHEAFCTTVIATKKAMLDYSQQQACAFLDWYFKTGYLSIDESTEQLYQQFLTQSDNGNK